MTKRQFSILLGLALQAGCAVYDEPIRRGPYDAGVDARRDIRSIADAIGESATLDATALDVEASDDASADTDTPDASSSGDAPEGVDANAWDDARDAADVKFADGAVDASSDAPTDVVAVDGSGSDGDALVDSFSDALRDRPIVGCSVDFTVSGVTWNEDGSTADGSFRGVRLVGDVGLLGAWDPAMGVPLTEKAPGAWSVSVELSDRVAVEFKFVKLPPGRAPEWEQWPPFDSNRSLLIDCESDGGTVWVDAGPAQRAVGRSYGGAFGVRPLDATK